MSPWRNFREERKKDLICKCGTPAKKMPRCGKRRYRHKCPHGKFCAHGDRLLGAHANHNTFCDICVAHKAALRLNADPGFLRGITAKAQIYRDIKERAALRSD